MAGRKLGAKPFPDVTWAEIRSFLLFMKEVRNLNPRTVNVYIAQLRDFYQYVLHRDWDRYQVSYLHYDGHKSLSSTSVYLTLGIGNGRSVTSPYDV